MPSDQPDNSADSRITAIEPGRRPKRFNIYVDGQFALAVGEHVIATLGLRVGQPADNPRMEQVAHHDDLQKALETAARLLSTRIRSESEITQRLRRHGFDETVMSEAITKLRAGGFVDDSEFAHQWVESRNRSAPKGARALKQELAQKGVDRLEIDKALQALTPDSELDLARHALARKIERTALPADGAARRSLYQGWAGFLQRRGFRWETIKSVLDETFGRASGTDNEAD